jgi:hypothetical protein
VTLRCLDARNDQFEAALKHTGEVLVASAHDIEMECCRVLVAKGVTSGKLVTWWAGKDFWAMKVDIVKGAKLSSGEHRFMPYVPWQRIDEPVEA